MSRISSEEMNERYTRDGYTKLYTLKLFFRNIGDLSEDDIKAIRKKMNRLKKEYEHVSWFIATSTTSSKNCKRVQEKTGQRGRPKTIVYGDKEKLHIHIGLISREVGKSASKFADDLREFILHRKKNIRGVQKQPLDGMWFIRYAYNQSDHFYTSNDYDFKQYYNGTHKENEYKNNTA